MGHRAIVATLLVGALLFVGGSLLPTALAGGGTDGSGTVQLILEARDDPDDCTDDRYMCLTVVDGSLEALEPGASVNLTLRNEGTTHHNAYVTTAAKADPDHEDTPGDARFAGTREEVESGETASVEFTVPEDAEGAYIWCDVTGHETSGMWLEVSFDTSGGEPPQDEPRAETQTVPGASVVLAIAAAVGVAVLRRRR